jgi:hypothetical protein
LNKAFGFTLDLEEELRGEHVIHKLVEEWVGLFVGGVVVMNLTIMVHDEYPIQANPHCPIRYGISVSVAETCVERVEFIREEVSDVFQGRYLKHLRLSVNDLSLEGADQTVWTQDHWAIWHHENLVLNYPFDVVPSIVCLAYGS